MSRTGAGTNPFSSTVLIINPSRYPKYVRVLRRILKEYDIPQVIETRDRDHFQEAVKEFSHGQWSNLLVWGGDGTAHAALNAMMQADRTNGATERMAMGFLRGGTGNGIQDSYDVPFSIRGQLAAYAESLEHGYEIDVDLLEVRTSEETYYCQLLGLGFDVEVLQRRERRRRQRKTKTALWHVFDYALAATQVYFGKRFRLHYPFDLRLRDGKYAFRGTRVNAEFSFDSIDRQVAPTMIEVGTRPYYGKLFKVCPDVVCNDGNMDLYIFNFEKKGAILANVVALWRGTHENINKRLTRRSAGVIERYELREMEIRSQFPFPFHVDGELTHAPVGENGIASVSLKILPERLTFIVPERFYKLFHPFQTESAQS